MENRIILKVKMKMGRVGRIKREKEIVEKFIMKRGKRAFFRHRGGVESDLEGAVNISRKLNGST